MTADVCILVEGTYPYVSGGVSAWIQSLIGNLPQYTFCVVHVGSLPEARGKQLYQFPDNVIEFREVFIHDTRWTHGEHTPRCDRALWSSLRDFHHNRAAGTSSGDAAIGRDVCRRVPEEIKAFDLLFATQTWEMLTELYTARAADSSFMDYFWTFRITHLPMLNLLQAEIPSARVYHAISAGYNALLGGLAKIRYGAPLLMTEHGIYTRERDIEIAQLDWVRAAPRSDYVLSSTPGYFQQWWSKMFRFIAKFSYELSDRVISITAANQQYELSNGADPDKMMVIPNGVDVEGLSAMPPKDARSNGRFVIGFVGRIVGIKDVKTFVRAIKIASAAIPDLLVFVVGPEGEEAEYAAQCHALVETLGLSAVIQFTGPQDVREYYRQMDVLVLTSLSEGQPLVILEAYCLGVPAIATDVGACRELLEGTTPEDVALGPSGLITPPAHPQATADALIKLWRDEELRARMSRAGYQRVRRFYRQENLYAAYDRLYRLFTQISPVAAHTTA